MAERPRDACSSTVILFMTGGDFKGWVTVRLDFRLKGYVYRQCLMGEWLCYDFVAGSFHTKNFVADFI